MACGILLVTHPGVGAAILAVATALLRHLPLKAEAFEVPFDADLEALLPQASAALRRVDGGGGVLVLTDLYGASPSNLAGRLALPVPLMRVWRGGSAKANRAPSSAPSPVISSYRQTPGSSMSSAAPNKESGLSWRGA